MRSSIETVIQHQRASAAGASHARTVTSASPCAQLPPTPTPLPSPLPPTIQNEPSYPTWARLSVVADAVYDVMRDFGVLRHREHVVAGAGDGVPDEKHAVPLPLQQRHSLLPAQPSPEPAAAVLRVKISGHGQHSKSQGFSGPSRLSLPLSASKAFNSYKNFSA